ncbi:MAG: CBS domain-containing protein [Lentisphaerae bacterium]|nr:CBS domain-containing protein [Lentisphaerota bacterium]
MVDEANKLLGSVHLNDVREIMFDETSYDRVFVKDLMAIPISQIGVDEPMERVMEKFEMTGAWNLPVVNNGEYKGFVSKSKIFSAYRELLMQFSDE